MFMLMFITLVLGIPVACGVAILKYHLYDLNLVIRKTLVYALLAGFVTLVYAGVVAALSSVVGGDSLVLSVVATGIVAALFQPVRRWATRLADRLVFGRRAEPYEVLSRFSDRVGGTLRGRRCAPEDGPRHRRGDGRGAGRALARDGGGSARGGRVAGRRRADRGPRPDRRGPATGTGPRPDPASASPRPSRSRRPRTSSWTTSPPRRASSFATWGSRATCRSVSTSSRAGRTSFGRPGLGSWRRTTRSDAGSSATSTTARSSTWSRSPSSSVWRRRSPPRATPPRRRRCCASSTTRPISRGEHCSTWPGASTPPRSRIGASRRRSRSRLARRAPPWPSRPRASTGWRSRPRPPCTSSVSRRCRTRRNTRGPRTWPFGSGATTDTSPSRCATTGSGSTAPPIAGSGLQNMRDRLSALGGEVEIRFGPRRGHDGSRARTASRGRPHVSARHEPQRPVGAHRPRGFPRDLAPRHRGSAVRIRRRTGARTCSSGSSRSSSSEASRPSAG